MREFVVDSGGAGRRLDVIIAAALPDVSRREARRLIDDGSVFVDGARTRTSSRALAVGTRVRVVVAPRRDDAKVVVLHRHGPLVFVDKAAFVPTEPTREAMRGALSHALLEQLRADGAHTGFLAAAHRLDVETSGVVAFACTRAAAERMRDRFSRGAITRRYLAVVEGSPPASRLECRARLVTNRGERVIVDDAGQEAVTVADVVARGPRGALLIVSIETGRRHQIRVHLAHEGLPLVGDRRYGSGPVADTFGLHAWSLAFVDGEERVSVTAAPSSSLLRALAAVGIDEDAGAVERAAKALEAS